MEIEIECAISSLWRSIRRHVKSGVVEVPFCLKYMMYKCGYDSIASIVSESNLPRSLEECMKYYLDALKEDVATNKRDPAKYLGPYANIDTFFLLPGHKALLKGLVQNLCKKDIENLKQPKETTRRNTGGNKKAALGDISSENRLLERFLKAFMLKNKLFGSPHFKIISHDIGDNGEMTSWPQAQVLCPRCSKRITLTRDKKRPRWNISNLTLHFQQQHCQNPPNKMNQSDKLCSEMGGLGNS